MRAEEVGRLKREMAGRQYKLSFVLSAGTKNKLQEMAHRCRLSTSDVVEQLIARSVSDQLTAKPPINSRWAGDKSVLRERDETSGEWSVVSVGCGLFRAELKIGKRTFTAGGKSKAQALLGAAALIEGFTEGKK